MSPRAEPPDHTATTSPNAAGWVRALVPIGMALLLAIVVVVQTPGSWPVMGLVVLGFGTYSLILWTRLRTLVTIDGDGITIHYALGLGRRRWEAGDFRSVRLRRVPDDRIGVTFGGVGKRRAGRVPQPGSGELTEVHGVKLFTTGQRTERALTHITRGGTLVEIVGRGEHNYVLSPDDPFAAGDAVAQLLRNRR